MCLIWKIQKKYKITPPNSVVNESSRSVKIIRVGISLLRSFDLLSKTFFRAQKRAIRSKNQKANSQPCHLPCMRAPPLWGRLQATARELLVIFVILREPSCQEMEGTKLDLSRLGCSDISLLTIFENFSTTSTLKRHALRKRKKKFSKN